MSPTKPKSLLHTFMLKQTSLHNTEAQKFYDKCVDFYLQNYVKHFPEY